MSTNFNVEVNGKKLLVKAGDNIEKIKNEFGNDASSIFQDVDSNNNGLLDPEELGVLKSNLKKSYLVELAVDGKTPRRAYNEAMQNLRNSYDIERLKEHFESDSTKMHKIQKGDTLYAIAKKQLEDDGLPSDPKSINNRIAQIANINRISDVNNIPVGTELIVKLTSDAVQLVKEKENDSALAFGGSGVVTQDPVNNDDTSFEDPQADDAVSPNPISGIDGKQSSITLSENGLNMGKGVPVDKDGNVLKNFNDSKYAQGGRIMKYTNPNHDPQVMYQITYVGGTEKTAFMYKNVKLSAPTIKELKELDAKYEAAASKIKKAPVNETAEAKATRLATNLAALKELVTLTGGNKQVIMNVAEKLRDDDYVDRKSDDYKAFVQDLLLTTNADVVSALTKDSENVDMSVVENDRTSHEYLARMYQKIREKEKAGEKLTDDEVKLKEALVNTQFAYGFKIEADEAKHVNEKYLNYVNDGRLSYATYIEDTVYWACDEKLLDEFVNKLKAANTDEKKTALFKEYANTKDVELARCLLYQAEELKASDEDIKTVINANGMYVLAKFNAEWSDDIKNAMLARIKDIYTKEKGNLENAEWLGVADDWIDKLPENQQEAARTEIAETYFEKTTTKDVEGNDKTEYTFNPKRRPTKEEMEGLLSVASEDMIKALVNYIKIEDMGKGQYNEAIEGSCDNTLIVSHYGDMVDSMTEKKEVLDFIDNIIVTAPNDYIPYDKILEKFPDDKDIKDKLLAHVNEVSDSVISDENKLALVKTYMKEEDGKITLDKTKLPKGTNAVNVLKVLLMDCRTGEAEKYFKALLKELNKGDLEAIKQVTNLNPKAVKARLAELVKANMSDKAFVQKVCKLDDSITPYQALYEVDANKAKWDDKTKQVVFEKIFNNRIKIKDRQKYLDGAVKSGLATRMAEGRYIIGGNVYQTDGWNDDNNNNKFDNDDTMSLRRMSKASYDNGAKLYGELKGAGSGHTAEMLKGEGNYKNFVTADNVAGLIQGFNDKSPNEGVMQYIASEWATIPQATCNVIPNKLMEKAKALDLSGSKKYKDLEKFVKSHTDTTKGYSEDEGKQLDALINALANQVLYKS